MVFPIMSLVSSMRIVYFSFLIVFQVDLDNALVCFPLIICVVCFLTLWHPTYVEGANYGPLSFMTIYFMTVCFIKELI